MSPQRPGRIQLPPKPRTQARVSLHTHEQRQIFYSKIFADWVFNLAGLLAFNFLLSLFPLMLLFLAGAGFTLKIFPPSLSRLEAALDQLFPAKTGNAIISAATLASGNLQRSALPILIIGVVTALFTGSRLFIAMENCFCVIYRTRPRPFLRRNILALLMTAALAIGGQFVFWASFVPTLMLSLLYPSVLSSTGQLAVQITGSAVGFVIAFLFFGLIYSILPNRRLSFQEVWKGAGLAAALLLAYEVAFPLYARYFLDASEYGSVAGFVILLLFFLYYLAFIVLLGAELNAWESGIHDPLGGFARYLRERAAMESAIRHKEQPPDSSYFEE